MAVRGGRWLEPLQVDRQEGSPGSRRGKEGPWPSSWNRCLGTRTSPRAAGPEGCARPSGAWSGAGRSGRGHGSSQPSTRQHCPRGAVTTPWTSSAPLSSFRRLLEDVQARAAGCAGPPLNGSRHPAWLPSIRDEPPHGAAPPRQLPLLQSRRHVTACDARHTACFHLLYGLISVNRTITEASSVLKNNDLLALFKPSFPSLCVTWACFALIKFLDTVKPIVLLIQSVTMRFIVSSYF